MRPFYWKSHHGKLHHHVLLSMNFLRFQDERDKVYLSRSGAKNTLIRLVARFFHLSGPAATPGSEPPGGTLGKTRLSWPECPWTGCWHRQETPSCSSADGPDPVRRKRWKIVRPRWEWQNVYKSRKIEVCEKDINQYVKDNRPRDRRETVISNTTLQNEGVWER